MVYRLPIELPAGERYHRCFQSSFFFAVRSVSPANSVFEGFFFAHSF